MGSVKDTNIILIGPSGSGKSTLGKLLGEKLKIPSLDLDELRWSYYEEIGYDKEKARQLRHEYGFAAMAAYWEQFSIHRSHFKNACC